MPFAILYSAEYEKIKLFSKPVSELKKPSQRMSERVDSLPQVARIDFAFFKKSSWSLNGQDFLAIDSFATYFPVLDLELSSLHSR